VFSPITGRAAAQVNPVAAKRDLDIVAALGRAFGHINMGVYNMGGNQSNRCLSSILLKRLGLRSVILKAVRLRFSEHFMRYIFDPPPTISRQILPMHQDVVELTLKYHARL
jgi:hypothetical protein